MSKKQNRKIVEINLADMEIVVDNFMDKEAYASTVMEDREREIKGLTDALIKEKTKSKSLRKELKSLKKKVEDLEKDYNRFDILDFGEKD